MSKKYVIEIKPEYEDSFKGLMILGAKDSKLFVDALAVENLEELNSDYINEHFGDLQDEAYRRGFEDGKGAIHKGCEGCRYSGTPQGDSPCFNCSNYYPNNWNKQDDNIEVGDEVRSTYGGKVMEDFTPWVVTLVTSETCYGFDADGNPRNNPNTMVQKTGRRFDIDKILGELRE